VFGTIFVILTPPSSSNLDHLIGYPISTI